jgi:DNA primase
MSIPPQFLEQIRSRLSLSEIIGRRIKVTRAGREFKACCPFHHEKTPSFTINDAKQFYHCFGCGAHGDVIKFVIEHDNLSFPDAVENLAALAGLQVPKQSPQQIQKAKEDKSLYDVVEATTAYFVQQLSNPSHSTAFDYIKGRGLSDETLSHFRVGFAPQQSDELVKVLRDQDFKDEQIIEAGVARKSKKNGQLYGFFRDRLMFPVTDHRGRVVAFGGRIMPDHLRAPDRGDFTPPKYINSSDSPIFNKGHILFGEADARKAAAAGHSVLVVEGYMDAIACYQAGFEGAVAPMGTALTEEQIAALWTMIPQDEKVPVLCFDGDNAGRRAAERACERILPLLKANQSSKFAFLPQGEDPDTLIKSSGAGAFRTVLQNALPLFDYIWSSAVQGRNIETPEAKAGLTKALEESIDTIADRDLQRYYKQELRDRISQAFFMWNKGGNQKGRSNQQNRGGRGGVNQKSKAMLRPPRPVNRKNTMGIRILIAAILNYPALYHDVEQEFGSLPISDIRFDHLRQSMTQALSDGEGLDSQALQVYLTGLGFAKEISDILHESVYVHASFCAPPYTSGSKSIENQDDETVVVSDSGRYDQWMKFYHSLNDQVLNDEIKMGWKQAFVASNEHDEARVKDMLQTRIGNGAEE